MRRLQLNTHDGSLITRVLSFRRYETGRKLLRKVLRNLGSGYSEDGIKIASWLLGTMSDFDLDEGQLRVAKDYDSRDKSVKSRARP